MPSNYQWEPRRSSDPASLERMSAHFRMPSSAMGEAWFMGGERRFFHELMRVPIEKLPVNTLTSVLFEISSGTSSFGHSEEWDGWFKYMLPGLIRRAADFGFFSNLLAQNVVSAFMSVYWKGIPEEYPGFRADVFGSLSLCLLNEELWLDHTDETTGETYPRATFLVWRDEEGSRLGWDAGRANENLSAMIFFCLKYLPAAQIGGWVESLVAVRDPFWKGALSVWLAGAYDLLREPSVTPSMVEKARPHLRWDDSHVLGSTRGSAFPPHEDDFNNDGDFLPPENAAAMLEAVRAQLTPELILDWAECFSRDALLEQGTYGVPELLLEKLSEDNAI